MGAVQGAMLGGQHNKREPGAAGHDIEMYCYQATAKLAEQTIDKLAEQGVGPDVGRLVLQNSAADNLSYIMSYMRKPVFIGLKHKAFFYQALYVCINKNFQIDTQSCYFSHNGVS